MLAVYLDDQVAKNDAWTTETAQYAINYPNMQIVQSGIWLDDNSTKIARFTSNDMQNDYDVVFEDNFVTVPSDVLNSDGFYLSFKYVKDDTTVTTNMLHFKTAFNTFNRPSLTPSQVQSLEDQLLAKMNQINNIKAGLKKCLNVFKQAVYKDDADFTILEEFENYIDNL